MGWKPMKLYHNFLMLFITAVSLLTITTATFDASANTLVTTLIEEVFRTPETHAALIQHGFESRFFFNDTGIEYGSVASMMHGQIKTMSTSFYHLWSCFENGAFLGYYQPDINIENRYTIGWQSNANHSCEGYNVSLEDSTSTGCREFFVAGRDTGQRAYSYNAVPYDCRTRSWYIATKEFVARRWASVWIDVTANKAALGLCVPLSNLTTKANDYNGVHADSNGLVGVACTGVFLEAISVSLLNSFTDLAGGKNQVGLGAFVVDRTTGLMIAAGTSVLGDYFDNVAQVQVTPSNSQNDAIRFASQVIANYTEVTNTVDWPDSYTTVAWVRNSSNTYPTLKYDAYYISTKVLREPGLEWDIVVIQEVDCPVNYYVDIETLVCTECVAPQYTDGGGSPSCDSCVSGYYLNENNDCEICPANAQCDGGLFYPRPNKNFWVDRNSGLSKKATKMHRCSRKTCHGASGVKPTCWLPECFGNADEDACKGCSESSLQCTKGAEGPLCGACEDGYIYQANVDACELCNNVKYFAYIIAGIFGSLAVITISIYKFQHKVQLLYRYLLKPFLFFDTGCLKVVWVTYQIIVSASFTLDVQYPYPFSQMLRVLSIFSFDFVGLKCLSRGDNAYYHTVYLWCGLPIIIALCIVIIGGLRIMTIKSREKLKKKISLILPSPPSSPLSSPFSTPVSARGMVAPGSPVTTPVSTPVSTPPGTPKMGVSRQRSMKRVFPTSSSLDSSDLGSSMDHGTNRASSSSMDSRRETMDDGYLPENTSREPTSVSQHIIDQHFWLLLFLSYIVLPVVSNKQLQTYDCLPLNGKSYLRKDTSIDCSSEAYLNFRSVILFFIILYQLIPIIWMIVLYRNRDALNPHKRDEHESYETRDNNPDLQSLKFLFYDYKCSKWWWEIADMYRRIIFIGILPLMSATALLRSSFGCIVAIMSVALFRETQPYRIEYTNVIANVAQFTILLTYYAAFSILAGGIFDFGLGDLGVGLFLVLINSIVLIMVAYFAYIRYKTDNEHNGWRRQLNSDELDIVNRVMGTHDEIFASIRTSHNNTGSMDTAIVSTYDEMDKQYIIQPKELIILKKVGAGAFGEIFKGIYLKKKVAIKTMIEITESNVREFRAEIILTASLRHPNIVYFVGACWGRDLMCLVLEWVAKGSLRNLLEHSKDLKWQDPLLRLTADIARGMNYLHTCVFYDENESKNVAWILHRDLKPDNALISDFTTAKLADFGTSRSVYHEDVTLSAVGTPLYVAPEIARGEDYDEKIDVYSFGVTLLEMCVEQNILEFIGSRWMNDMKKKRIPKKPRKYILPMQSEGWRPVTLENPITFAPSSINSLIIRCCDHNPINRPSFSDILDELNNKCKIEIENGSYGRKPLDDASHALSTVNLNTRKSRDVTPVSSPPITPTGDSNNRQPSYSNNSYNNYNNNASSLPTTNNVFSPPSPTSLILDKDASSFSIIPPTIKESVKERKNHSSDDDETLGDDEEAQLDIVAKERLKLPIEDKSSMNGGRKVILDPLHIP